MQLSSKRFTIGIVGVAFFLFLIDIYAYLHGFYDIKNLYLFKKFLNPATERNIPTLLSSFLFFMIGKTLRETLNKKGIAKLYAFFFYYLALDDLFMIHEQLGSLIGKSILKGHWKGYYWHAIYDPVFFIIFGSLYIFLSIQFLKSKQKLPLLLLTIGYFLYGISQLMDYYEGLKPSFALAEEFTGLPRHKIIHIFRTIEETTEMIASAMILHALFIWGKIKVVTLQISLKLSTLGKDR